MAHGPWPQEFRRYSLETNKTAYVEGRPGSAWLNDQLAAPGHADDYEDVVQQAWRSHCAHATDAMRTFFSSGMDASLINSCRHLGALSAR